MARGNDEPVYALRPARMSIETRRSQTFVTFRLDPKARSPTASRYLPKTCCFRGPCWPGDKGRPNHRLYYAR